MPTVAFLAQGKLYLANGSAEPRLVESDFVQELLDRTERSRERHQWKNEGMAWNLRAGGINLNPSQAAPSEVRCIQFTSIARGHHPGEFFYAIATDSVGGIFHYEVQGGYERRLVHRNQLRVEDLCMHPSERVLALTLRNADATSHLGTMEVDRRGIRAATEGDCVDEAPSWVPNAGKQLMYQSAGISRDAQGFYQALGPYALCRLNLDSSSSERVLHDDKQDFLLPRIDTGGRLLFIRRPYEPFTRPSLLTTASDALLFPFRVVRTVVHLLHWMSLVFSGKPLISAGGPKRPGPAPEQLMLWGRIVEANKALRSRGETAKLVPGSWQLVARCGNGEEQVLARNVVYYDLAADGAVVYTDGRRLHRIGKDGAVDVVAEGTMIQKLAAIA